MPIIGDAPSASSTAHPSKLATDAHAGGSVSFFVKWMAGWAVLLAVLLCFLPDAGSAKPTGDAPVVQAECSDTETGCPRWAQAGECQKSAQLQFKPMSAACTSVPGSARPFPQPQDAAHPFPRLQILSSWANRAAVRVPR